MRIERNGRAVMINFDATQEARLAALRQANREAAALVDEAYAMRLNTPPGDEPAEPRTLLVTVSYAEDSIKAKQRQFLHFGVLPQIAEQVVLPGGVRYTEKAWKELFRERFLGWRWVSKPAVVVDASATLHGPPPSDTLVRERVSSEDLNSRDYGLYIDRIIDTAADQYGVRFVFKPGQREGARRASKARNPKMAVPQNLPGLHS